MNDEPFGIMSLAALLPLHEVRGTERMNLHQKQLTFLFALALIFCVAGIAITYWSLT